MSGDNSFQYLTTPEQVQAWLQAAQAADWLAVDTEFVRESTYAPQLCLVQLAGAPGIALVDVLALGGLDPLRAALESGPRKLMHSPGQDLEAFATCGVQRIAPLFDTQTAHALLGGATQIGYAGIVEQRLGIAVDKGQTRTDWSRRPLSAAQQAYAADDVRHLAALEALLREQLEAAGRGAWMDEEMARWEQPWAPVDPLAMALRSRGLERLEPAEQRIYAALVVWREERARRADKPRSWIAKDGLLHALARRRPETLDALRAVPDLPPGLLRHQGSVLLDVVAGAPQQVPELPAPLPRAALKALQKALAEVAQGLGIEPAVLASRGDCERWLRSGEGLLAGGWRAQEAAAVLAAHPPLQPPD